MVVARECTQNIEFDKNTVKMQRQQYSSKAKVHIIIVVKIIINKKREGEGRESKRGEIQMVG